MKKLTLISTNSQYSSLRKPSFVAIIMSGAIAFLTLMEPVQGANDENLPVVIKVNRLLTKVSAVQTKVSKVQDNVGDMQAALDNLKTTKQRFVDEAIDPTELLDMVDLAELKAVIDEIKDNFDEFNALDGNQNGNFKDDFLDFLADMNVIVAEDGGLVESEVTPFETFINKFDGDSRVIAVLMQAS